MTSWSTSSCTQPIIAVRSRLTCGPRDLRLPTRTLFTPFGNDWWNSRSNDANVQSHTFSCSSILRGPAGFGSCQFSSWSMEHGALGRFDHCDSRRDPPFRGAISIGEVLFSYTAGPRTGDSRHYSKIRNPIYVFSTLFVIGLLLALQIPRALVFVPILIAVQLLRAHREAKVLQDKF